MVEEFIGYVLVKDIFIVCVYESSDISLFGIMRILSVSPRSIIPNCRYTAEVNNSNKDSSITRFTRSRNPRTMRC